MTDRVGEFFEHSKYKHKTIVTPEGIPLDVRVAGNAERLIALMIDLFIIFVAIVILYIIAGLISFAFNTRDAMLTQTPILFLIFVITNFYFVHFELKWQGRTPGKRAYGLRVINREGGELSASAILARNFMREVEVFFPLKLFVVLAATDAGWQALTLFGWAFVMAILPVFNKEHLRMGDIIAGTQVISMPKRALLGDLATRQKARYSFTPEQLSRYGAFELQVLEELLRRPQGQPGTEKMLGEVAGTICRKIQWPDVLQSSEVRAFLNDFYAAERAQLERGQLFGQYKEDKFK
jgi:uncharacterized RDD family membrane protein YckC